MVNSPSISRSLLTLIVVLLAIRFCSMALYPLFDTTEARYGEIARLMFETQNWVTPQIDYNQPFWGKPPLYTWISAASFQLFGVSEFSARLPHFVVGVLVLLLVYRFTRFLTNSKQGILAVTVLCTCLGFIVAMGMVMTDTLLLLAITLAMTSFWYCFKHQERHFHGHLFFAALGLGMLAKGPVAIVLIGISLFSWALYSKQVKAALRSLPWLSGMVLFLLITLPWYIWAEIRTPGFLNYFLVGEHFYRFVQPGWSGDLYGTAHTQPKGMIWLFWLVAAFPWSFYLLHLAYKTSNFTNVIETNKSQSIVAYLVAWLIAPMLLFTMAGNILAIYVMPGFAALAVLIALGAGSRAGVIATAYFGFVLILCLLSAVLLGLLNKSSEAELLRQNHSSSLLYYWQNRPFSAQFYSSGQAQTLTEEGQLQQLLIAGKSFDLVLTDSQYANFNKQYLSQCKAVASSRKRRQFRCNE